MPYGRKYKPPRPRFRKSLDVLPLRMFKRLLHAIRNRKKPVQ